MPINLVSEDNAMGGRMAAEYLFRLGHRRVIYLGHRAASITHQLRCRGFCAAAEELGMEVRVLENTGPSSTLEVGYRLAKELFFQDFPETAVFASSDAVALGVMQAADEFGIAIPERLSLLGFDNISYAALPKIRLTTIDQRKREQAEAAVNLLLELIDHPGQGEYTRRLLPPVLQERSSCRAI
jgi:LacI family transcriptional regulator